MTFEQLHRTWEILGRDDPFWAVLSHPSKHNNKWDSAEFFATGKEEIDTLFEGLKRRELVPISGRCLDFGCGVGRVTQALCAYFGSVDGVDIAQSMIDAANRYNQHGERCRYHLNAKDDLSLFRPATFDFVYSNIVLQHMETELAERYIAEFMRVLAPGGVAVFQVPSQFHELQRSPLRTHKSQICVEQVAALEAGSRRAVTVLVRNVSDEIWPITAPIQVGNHWLDRHGSVLVVDDGRAPLPGDMRPGDERSVGVWVTAPAVPGRYILEFDLVEEQVAWFGAHNSMTARIPVDITRPSLLKRTARTLRDRRRVTTNDGGDDSPAVMEMHAVPKERVVAIAAAGGGQVVDIEDFDVSGPEWESYRYFIRKTYA
ncbi:MAG TPA: class I SAM-dependent methyltransferase [Chloroflexota bacterium]